MASGGTAYGAGPGDPFDRILIAQARRIGSTLVTSDGRIREREVSVLDATR